jgi:hypothetical protein
MYAPFTADHAHARIRQLTAEPEKRRAVALARSTGPASNGDLTATLIPTPVPVPRPRPKWGARWIWSAHS